jgi:hypothetical protein
MEDPILEAIMHDAPEGFLADAPEKYEDSLYGEGTHKGAKFLDVVTYPESDKGFGFRIGLKFDLRPERDDPYEYTCRLDLERELVANGHAVENWKAEKEVAKREVLNNALHAVGFHTPVKQAITTQEQYDFLVNIFRQHVGAIADVRVVADGKNVFVAEEGGKVTRDGVQGNWVFEGNGYTKTAWIRPHREAKGKKK